MPSPSPPGRAPNAENWIRFESASVARVGGFRPCKQCGPDV
ncbi:Ada metal-binding domain-containing protein [Singulisphaera sp. Ch08]